MKTIPNHYQPPDRGERVPFAAAALERGLGDMFADTQARLGRLYVAAFEARSWMDWQRLDALMERLAKVDKVLEASNPQQPPKEKKEP